MKNIILKRDMIEFLNAGIAGVKADLQGENTPSHSAYLQGYRDGIMAVRTFVENDQAKLDTKKLPE